jgi:hypothetical protein
MRGLCQTRALTQAMNAAVDPSVKKLTTNFTFVIQINKCVCTKHVSSYVINHQCFHLFVIIRRVALQDYKEYNNLPYRMFGTTESIYLSSIFYINKNVVFVCYMAYISETSSPIDFKL